LYQNVASFTKTDFSFRGSPHSPELQLRGEYPLRHTWGRRSCLPVDDEGFSMPDSDVHATDTLALALARHRLELPPEHVSLLDKYCQLLWDWNENLNLTRHTDYEKFAGRDVADSLQLAAHLRPAEELLDVGTGGGVPGVVLAIIRPDLKVALCDSVGKKARAVESIVKDLGLDVPVYPFRAEEMLEDMRYDALVIRAVGPLWKLLAGFKPHWHSFRRMLVIKGPKWTEELNEARRRGLMSNLQLKTVAKYPMPGAEGQSVVLKIWPKGIPER
jgi:16S rRNA (guanine527-N7)-methyltransferase